MTPRKRRLMIGFAALLLTVWFIVTLVSLVNVQTNLDVQTGEASAEVGLGNLQCQKTFSQTFPFFKMTCEEVNAEP